MDAIGAKPDRVIWDDHAPGLGLRVQSGKRTWIVRYRVARSQRQSSASGDLSLKKARAWAADIRTGAGKGADIIAEGRAAAEAAKREAEAAKARSLGKIIEKYLLDAGKRLRPASYKVAKLYLTGARYWQQLADRPADALGRREILAVLEPWNGKVTAAQMLYHLSACLTSGVERSLLERNCATGIKPPVQKVDRERVLTDAEMRQLWAATEPTGADTVEDRYAMILRLLLLTGQRRGEVGGVRRTELDPERQVWHLPGERTKNGLPHDVPLSRQVTAILQAPELTGTDHLFGEGGLTPGGGPSSIWTPALPSGVPRAALGGRLQRVRSRRPRCAATVDSARPTPHRGHGHGGDRHRAAHRRGGGKPHKWSQRRRRRCI